MIKPTSLNVSRKWVQFHAEFRFERLDLAFNWMFRWIKSFIWSLREKNPSWFVNSKMQKLWKYFQHKPRMALSFLCGKYIIRYCIFLQKSYFWPRFGETACWPWRARSWLRRLVKTRRIRSASFYLGIQNTWSPHRTHLNTEVLSH